MKLWLKIFLSILIVSLTTLFISTSYVINKSHIDNIHRETERSLNEYELIQLSIRNSVDITTSTEETLRTVVSRYGDYYVQRDIHLILYRNNKFIYNNLTSMDQIDYNNLISVELNTKMVQIIQQKSNHVLFVSGLLSEENNTIFVYARDISNIYQARKQSMQLTIMLALLLIFILGLFSFLYSRWITKPLEILQKGAVAISYGNYDVRVENSKDEFNELANAFNKMASAIESRTTELEERAKELQVFIDDLSHEMNTPLTSIQGYAEFLQSANASEDQRCKAAQTIRSEAKRMKDIYTKLMTLTFAREHNIDLTEIKIKDLLSDVEETLFHQLKERNISLTVHSQITTLTIDRTLFHMLITNLVRNSIQAIQQDGTIQIKAYEENNKHVIEVSDNGSGIPKDKIKEVMKPFYRVDKSRSRKTGGAGLGLSICKSIANLHNADIVIESQMGVGTTVKVIFPI